MNRIAEMVEAEAGPLEAADAEQPEAEASAPEKAPKRKARTTEKQIEEGQRLMAAEAERHARVVSDIMGDDFEAVYPCPTCSHAVVGFVFDPPSQAPPLVKAEYFNACPACNGWGQVLTGALSDHGAQTTCRTCNGQGYIEVPLAPAYQAPPPQAAAPPLEAVQQLRNQGYMVIEPPRPVHPQGA